MKRSPSSRDRLSQTPNRLHKYAELSRLSPLNQEPEPTTTVQRPQILPSVATLTAYGIVPIQPGDAARTNSASSGRTFGVHSILNPTAEFERTERQQRVSQSPGKSVYDFNQTGLISPKVRKRRDEHSPGKTPQMASENQHVRRILTPKSPALRSISRSMKRSPRGGVSSRVIPGGNEGRVYTTDPGDSSEMAIPPLPQMTFGSHSLNNVQNHEHMTSPAPGKHNDSTPSYSAINQDYIGSPGSSSNFAERESTPAFRPSMSDSAPHLTMTRSYGSGQPAYQMRLPGDQGMEVIPVEVDIQQASKSADEKRKRNAGASARFRQRRKEKEAVASQTIDDLRKQIRDLTEDRDWYLGERNFFRDLAARTSSAQPPARPLSPCVRRAQAAGQYAGGTEPSRTIEYTPSMTESSPTQRRRISDYQPAFATPPVGTGGFSPAYMSVQGQAYGLPPPSLPAPIPDSRAQISISTSSRSGPPSVLSHTGVHPPPPPSSLPPGMRSQTYDPFRRDLNTR